MVVQMIESAFKDQFAVETVLMSTTGDKILSSPLHKIPAKNLFTKELEQALLQHKVDLVVHSLKDLATTLPAGLSIGAYLEREDPRDVLISRDNVLLQDLPVGSVVGTSSLRRQCILKNLYPHLQFLDIVRVRA